MAQKRDRNEKEQLDVQSCSSGSNVESSEVNSPIPKKIEKRGRKKKKQSYVESCSSGSDVETSKINIPVSDKTEKRGRKRKKQPDAQSRSSGSDVETSEISTPISSKTEKRGRKEKKQPDVVQSCSSGSDVETSEINTPISNKTQKNRARSKSLLKSSSDSDVNTPKLRKKRKNVFNTREKKEKTNRKKDIYCDDGSSSSDSEADENLTMKIKSASNKTQKNRARSKSPLKSSSDSDVNTPKLRTRRKFFFNIPEKKEKTNRKKDIYCDDGSFSSDSEADENLTMKIKSASNKTQEKGSNKKIASSSEINLSNTEKEESDASITSVKKSIEVKERISSTESDLSDTDKKESYTSKASMKTLKACIKVKERLSSTETFFSDIDKEESDTSKATKKKGSITEIRSSEINLSDIVEQESDTSKTSVKKSIEVKERISSTESDLSDTDKKESYTSKARRMIRRNLIFSRDGKNSKSRFIVKALEGGENGRENCKQISSEINLNDIDKEESDTSMTTEKVDEIKENLDTENFLTISDVDETASYEAEENATSISENEDRNTEKMSCSELKSSIKENDLTTSKTKVTTSGIHESNSSDDSAAIKKGSTVTAKVKSDSKKYTSYKACPRNAIKTFSDDDISTSTKSEIDMSVNQKSLDTIHSREEVTGFSESYSENIVLKGCFVSLPVLTEEIIKSYNLAASDLSQISETVIEVSDQKSCFEPRSSNSNFKNSRIDDDDDNNGSFHTLNSSFNWGDSDVEFEEKNDSFSCTVDKFLHDKTNKTFLPALNKAAVTKPTEIETKPRVRKSQLIIDFHSDTSDVLPARQIRRKLSSSESLPSIENDVFLLKDADDKLPMQVIHKKHFKTAKDECGDFLSRNENVNLSKQTTAKKKTQDFFSDNEDLNLPKQAVCKRSIKSAKNKSEDKLSEGKDDDINLSKQVICTKSINKTKSKTGDICSDDDDDNVNLSKQVVHKKSISKSKNKAQDIFSENEDGNVNLSKQVVCKKRSSSVKNKTGDFLSKDENDNVNLSKQVSYKKDYKIEDIVNIFSEDENVNSVVQNKFIKIKKAETRGIVTKNKEENLITSKQVVLGRSKKVMKNITRYEKQYGLQNCSVILENINFSSTKRISHIENQKLLHDGDPPIFFKSEVLSESGKTDAPNSSFCKPYNIVKIVETSSRIAYQHLLEKMNSNYERYLNSSKQDAVKILDKKGKKKLISKYNDTKTNEKVFESVGQISDSEATAQWSKTFLCDTGDNYCFKSKCGKQYIVTILENDVGRKDLSVTVNFSIKHKPVSMYPDNYLNKPKICKFGCQNIIYNCIHKNITKNSNSKRSGKYKDKSKNYLNNNFGSWRQTGSLSSDLDRQNILTEMSEEDSTDPNTNSETDNRPKTDFTVENSDSCVSSSRNSDLCCVQCNAPFSDLQEHYSHTCVGKRKKGYICKYCEQIFSSYPPLKKHKKIHVNT